jgi:hypothetical protein
MLLSRPIFLGDIGIKRMSWPSRSDRLAVPRGAAKEPFAAALGIWADTHCPGHCFVFVTGAQKY